MLDPLCIFSAIVTVQYNYHVQWRIQRRGLNRGSGPPMKSYKNIGFICNIVQQNLDEYLEDLGLDFKLFSFAESGSVYIVLENPSDATLTSLSISIYPRWRPRWRPIINK